MPKVSKVPTKRVSGEKTRSTTGAPKKGNRLGLCTRCGREYPQRSRSFIPSRSPLYKGAGGYLCVCNDCLEDMFGYYTSVLGSEAAAVERLCLKFDVYWSEKMWESVLSHAQQANSKIRTYFARTNLAGYNHKTYDDNLFEAARAKELEAEKVAGLNRFVKREDGSATSEVQEGLVVGTQIPEVSEEMIEFWGEGLPREMYSSLAARYAKWTEKFENGLDSAGEARYKQICILEETINRNVASSGKADSAAVNTLNSLIKEAQRGDGVNESFDDLPFGVGIRMFENARPVPRSIPELQDVDGVVKYVSVWFLGHLCKMLGIKNTYCKLYEEEIERLRVERPDLEDEDDEGAFNDIFGGGGDE